MMKENRCLLSVLIFLCIVLAPDPASPQEVGAAEAILRSYVEDFRSDPAAADPMTFGVRIMGESGGEWGVVIEGRKEASGDYDVDLRNGLPSTPAVLFTLNLDTLQKMDRGEINALTAMGKARAADPAPMDIEFMDGFQPGVDFFARFIPFTFHFWTRGFPEIVSFGKGHSREVHGAHMVVFYYQEGLRSAWAQMEKGQHVNADPEDQTNPFPTIIIGIRGKAVAKIGGKETPLQEGQMVFIPAGVSHEAWNPHDEPAEIILLMFGEGA